MIKRLGCCLFFLLTYGYASAQLQQQVSTNPSKMLELMKKVASWQLKNPTGKELNSWEYGPFYIGLMALHNVSGEGIWLDSIKAMGERVNWETVPRPYDANVLAISQVFIELYEKDNNKKYVDKSRFVMDAPMRRELEPDITFDKNKYWWEWWSWCDAIFMAPPAYARMATVFNEPKYMDFMIQEFKRTSTYLYSKKDSLYFRDDRFFTMKSTNGQPIFWSRGNGWVLAGLARVLQYLPKQHPDYPYFLNQYKEIAYKIKRLQMKNGFWSQSLLDPENYPQKESSGTGFYVYAMTWGINQGILPATKFGITVEKGWKALQESVHPNGKLGYVQEVGDAPTDVSFDDTETYGTGAFLLAGSELVTYFKNGRKPLVSKSVSGEEDRAYTIQLLQEISDPVIRPLSEERLHKQFPRKDWETRESNIETSPLQAFGRSLSGLAPWLSLGADETKEGKLRSAYIDLARKSLINATNPSSADYLFGPPTQERIVHAAYIAYPLLLAPKQLWDPLTQEQQKNIIAALKTHRLFKPNKSNWLLFPAIIETAIFRFTGDANLKTIRYAVKKMDEWYLGDGLYGDGPDFHRDYYNSYVIHPLLIETIRQCSSLGLKVKISLEESVERGKLYSKLIENMISPEGTFPVTGRSSVYRIAALQLLEYLAFRDDFIPATCSPGATRAAITAVIRNMMSMPGTFDETGYLNAGIVGEQVNARDYYNYTGALYMCMVGLTHLGIPAEKAFWQEEATAWTQQRIWNGENLSGQEIFK
ncbi:MAG: DUF2264 domain-containing protein [Flavipsychrobacter sp.]|nr:DUF2264 domain-containing protein [Flavipsychrobacter sp.]